MTQKERKDALITYMRAKIEEGDWHGVSDAANDLRELEVEMRLKPDAAPTPQWYYMCDVHGKVPLRSHEPGSHCPVCKWQRAKADHTWSPGAGGY